MRKILCTKKKTKIEQTRLAIIKTVSDGSTLGDVLCSKEKTKFQVL